MYFLMFQVLLGASVSMLARPAPATTTHVSMAAPVLTPMPTTCPSTDVNARLVIWVGTKRPVTFFQ